MKPIRSSWSLSRLLVVALVVSLAFWSALPASSAGKTSAKRRASNRAARLLALGELDERLAAHLEKLEALVLEWFAAGVELPDENRAEFEQLLGAARKLGSEKLRGTTEEVLSRIPDGRTASATSPSSLQRRFKDHRKRLTDDLLDEAKTALKLDSGVRLYFIAAAVRCLLDGNKVLAKALGKRLYRDVWLDETECEYLKKGYVWDQRFGWIRRGETNRYLTGEYFEVGGRTWTTLDAANSQHSEPEKPWDIETDQFHLRGTAKLKDLLALTDVLIENRMRMLAVLSPLFDERTKSPKERALLHIGERRHAPFRIYLSRTKVEFEKRDPDMAGSLGYYSPSNKCTFLFQEAGPDGSEVLSTARHEAMHQTFTEVLLFNSPDAPGARGFPMWAEEGLAEYFCYVEDRSTRFGEFQKKYAAGLADLIKKTFLARTVDEWDELDRATGSDSYVMAEMIVSFLLEGRSGEYEADFFGLLQGSARDYSPPLEFIGLTLAEFSKQIKEWAKPDDDPK